MFVARTVSTVALHSYEDSDENSDTLVAQSRLSTSAVPGLSDASRASCYGASLAAFVLGMHRSGTSAVTRVINLLGVPLNVRADWLPETPQDNPRGFWESASLLEVNDAILATFGGTWMEPPR